MKIIVYLRQMFEPATIRLHAFKGMLVKEDVVGIINPADKTALEVALQIREREGGTVTAVMAGDSYADLLLREAIAMGADTGVLLPQTQPEGQASAVASAINSREWDLALSGSVAIDAAYTPLALQLAAELGVPGVNRVDEVKNELESLLVKSRFVDGYQTLRVPYPCVITVEPDMCEARGMHAGKVFEAYHEGKVDTGAEASPNNATKAQLIGFKNMTPSRRREILRGDEDDMVCSILEILTENAVIASEEGV